ncbi:MAG: inositol monophosphatase [Patescibacteria group bacterium]|nr:inositol monophosphatase [Patescibacteria group bacterium]
MILSKEDVNYIENVLKSAGKVLLRHFKNGVDFKEKTSVRDLVTKADLESNNIIVSKLREKYPDINVSSEEKSDKRTNSAYRFIVDPLEGTSNFTLNIPVFVIAVALVDRKKCLFSMVYNPITDITYYALLGKGAFKNKQQIKVNNNNDVSRSSVHTNYSYNTLAEVRNKIDKALYDLRIRRKLDDWCGIYQHCLLAEGKIEVVLTDDTNEYDAIPGKFIAEEAGAKITDWSGMRIEDLSVERNIASNGLSLHQELVNILSKI